MSYWSWERSRIFEDEQNITHNMLSLTNATLRYENNVIVLNRPKYFAHPVYKQHARLFEAIRSELKYFVLKNVRETKL